MVVACYDLTVSVLHFFDFNLVVFINFTLVRYDFDVGGAEGRVFFSHIEA